MLEDSSRQNCATVVCFALWVARCQQKKISPRQNCTRVVSRLVACRHLPNHHLGTHPPPTTGIFYKMILNLHILSEHDQLPEDTGIVIRRMEALVSRDDPVEEKPVNEYKNRKTQIQKRKRQIYKYL